MLMQEDVKRMHGTMLWFNIDKGYGFIRTEHDERLSVARAGFRAGHEPEPRCKGREVVFAREAGDGEPYATDVCYVAREEPRRARLRSSRGGSKL
jgi:cold shock CspA family protein